MVSRLGNGRNPSGVSERDNLPKNLPSTALEEFRQALGPLVHGLLRDASGALNLERVSAKSLDEFIQVLSDQAALNDGFSFRNPYQKLLKKEKYSPLLKALHERGAEGAKDSPEREAELHELFEAFQSELIKIDADKFVQGQFNSDAGRVKLRKILGDTQRYGKDARSELVKAIARAGEREKVAVFYQIDGVTDQISLWNYFNISVTEEELSKATLAAEDILSAADFVYARQNRIAKKEAQDKGYIGLLRPEEAGRVIYHADLEAFEKLAREKSELKDPVSQVQAQLAQLWVLAARDSNWTYEAVGVEKGRGHILRNVEVLLKQSESIQSEAQLKQFNGKLQGFLQDPIFGVKGIEATPWEITKQELYEIGKHHVVGNGLEEFFSETPQHLKGPYEQILSLSNGWKYSWEMGERIGTQIPEQMGASSLSQEEKQYVDQLCEALQRTKQELWQGYKQHKAISRLGSQMAHLVGRGGIADIEKANQEIDRRIAALRRADSKEAIQSEAQSLYESLKKDGVLYEAFAAAEMDGTEQLLGLVQTVAVTIGMGMLTKGAGWVVEADVALLRIAMSARGLRMLQGFAMGAEMSVAENAIAVVSGEVREGHETVAKWFKDAMATGLSMTVTAAAPMSEAAKRSLIQNALARYTVGGVKAVKHLLADSGLEAAEELIDQYTRQVLDGKTQALTWQEISEIVSISLAGGGMKIGSAVESIQRRHDSTKPFDLLRAPSGVIENESRQSLRLLQSPLLAPMWMMLGVGGVGIFAKGKTREDGNSSWHPNTKNFYEPYLGAALPLLMANPEAVAPDVKLSGEQVKELKEAAEKLVREELGFWKTKYSDVNLKIKAKIKSDIFACLTATVRLGSSFPRVIQNPLSSQGYYELGHSHTDPHLQILRRFHGMMANYARWGNSGLEAGLFPGLDEEGSEGEFPVVPPEHYQWVLPEGQGQLLLEISPGMFESAHGIDYQLTWRGKLIDSEIEELVPIMTAGFRRVEDGYFIEKVQGGIYTDLKNGKGFHRPIGELKVKNAKGKVKNLPGQVMSLLGTLDLRSWLVESLMSELRQEDPRANFYFRKGSNLAWTLHKIKDPRDDRFFLRDSFDELQSHQVWGIIRTRASQLLYAKEELLRQAEYSIDGNRRLEELSKEARHVAQALRVVVNYAKTAKALGFEEAGGGYYQLRLQDRNGRVPVVPLAESVLDKLYALVKNTPTTPLIALGVGLGTMLQGNLAQAAVASGASSGASNFFEYGLMAFAVTGVFAGVWDRLRRIFERGIFRDKPLWLPEDEEPVHALESYRLPSPAVLLPLMPLSSEEFKAILGAIREGFDGDVLAAAMPRLRPSELDQVLVALEDKFHRSELGIQWQALNLIRSNMVRVPQDHLLPHVHFLEGVVAERKPSGKIADWEYAANVLAIGETLPRLKAEDRLPRIRRVLAWGAHASPEIRVAALSVVGMYFSSLPEKMREQTIKLLAQNLISSEWEVSQAAMGTFASILPLLDTKQVSSLEKTLLTGFGSKQGDLLATFRCLAFMAHHGKLTRLKTGGGLIEFLLGSMELFHLLPSGAERESSLECLREVFQAMEPRVRDLFLKKWLENYRRGHLPDLKAAEGLVYLLSHYQDGSKVDSVLSLLRDNSMIEEGSLSSPSGSLRVPKLIYSIPITPTPELLIEHPACRYELRRLVLRYATEEDLILKYARWGDKTLSWWHINDDAYRGADEVDADLSRRLNFLKESWEQRRKPSDREK